MPRHSDYNPPFLKPSSAATSPPTPTGHPSSDGNSTTSHQSHSNDATTTPPLKLLPPPPPPPKNTPFPVREDCWSEDATFTLIDAWGERFLQLKRGNLRQNHWKEVADAVNSRHGHVKKNRRTDVQCKNRIDTLKKKFKLEKSKVLGAQNYVSSWPFFSPLDSLIGSVFKPSTKTPMPPPRRKRIPAPAAFQSFPALPPPPSSVPVGRRSKRPPQPLAVFQPSTDNSCFRRNFSLMAAAAAAIDGGEGDSDTSWSSGGNRSRKLNGNRCRIRTRTVMVEKDDESGGDPYSEVAEAIGRFAEVYARVEEAKQRQMVELEKQRMQFTKDLELQRMKMLMESQVHLEKLKRLKTHSDADFNRMDEDHSTSVN